MWGPFSLLLIEWGSICSNLESPRQLIITIFELMYQVEILYIWSAFQSYGKFKEVVQHILLAYVMGFDLIEFKEKAEVFV